MTVPVLKNLLQQHQQLEVTVVSNGFHAPLFAGIERLHFFAADFKQRHKGILGLYRLYRELQGRRINAVADLHHVLRTRILKLFFNLRVTPWVVVDKGRQEKKTLTRRENKELRPLKSTFRRYADVFGALGFAVKLEVASGIKPKGAVPALLAAGKEKGKRSIGIAPFAQYERKTYPVEKMKELLRMLAQHAHLQLFLLGGKADTTALQQLASGVEAVQVVAGSLDFAAELNFISQLDMVISMDSANMHLASMYGVPVVSIWGATHPYAGFYGWGQAPENAVQIDLSCRPCSVFGNKAGPRTDLACMHGISPVVVYERVMRLAAIKE